MRWVITGTPGTGGNRNSISPTAKKTSVTMGSERPVFWIHELRKLRKTLVTLPTPTLMMKKKSAKYIIFTLTDVHLQPLSAFSCRDATSVIHSFFSAGSIGLVDVTLMRKNWLTVLTQRNSINNGPKVTEPKASAQSNEELLRSLLRYTEFDTSFSKLHPTTLPTVPPISRSKAMAHLSIKSSTAEDAPDTLAAT